jgi:sensor domain CHASE-containing protein
LEGAVRLTRQLSRASLFVFVAVTATVILALLWATHQSDTVSVQRQERIARHAMEIALDELALQQETVSIWDESAQQMLAPVKDHQWLFHNVGSWLHRIFNHDETWLLDERNRPVQIVIGGQIVPHGHFWQRQADLQKLIRGARGEIPGENGQHDRNPGKQLTSHSSVRTTPRTAHDTHLILVGGRPAAASVMLIKPSTPGYVGERDAWPALVSIRYLDSGFARDLQTKHLIDAPRFRRARRPGWGRTFPVDPVRVGRRPRLSDLDSRIAGQPDHLGSVACLCPRNDASGGADGPHPAPTHAKFARSRPPRGAGDASCLS